MSRKNTENAGPEEPRDEQAAERRTPGEASGEQAPGGTSPQDAPDPANPDPANPDLANPGASDPGASDPGAAAAPAAGEPGFGEPGFGETREADTVARLEAEIAELKDRLLRALAETENVRRRAERDRQEAAEHGGAKLARDLLPVYDNLERALGHADEAAREKAGAVIDGVELTRRELLSAFARHKIEKFTPQTGERFDPHFQQAMFEAPVPGARPGTVIEVIQAGFTIAGRLLRPALVGVAKAQAGQMGGQAGGQERGQEPGQGAGGEPSTDRRA